MNNAAAIGYMILAMKKLGYSDEAIQRVEAVMREVMSVVPEEKAEKKYNEF